MRYQRLRFCLRLLFPECFGELDILADTLLGSQPERVSLRISENAINGKVSSPKANKIIRKRRGLYSNSTLWSPGGSLIPIKLGISMTVAVSTPSTVARQLG